MSRTIPDSTRPSVIVEGGQRIPAGVQDLEEFRRWSESDQFPERGRIDYLQGDVEVDMSPEELLSHGTPKTAIAIRLGVLVQEARLGFVFIDRARLVSPAAGLSAEPDLVVVLEETLAADRVRLVPSSRAGRYVEMEGAPDLVVEVISDSSVAKDRERLPKLYAQASIPELWLADARRDELCFEIWTLGVDGYSRVPSDAPGADGWTWSPVLGRRFRLRRGEVRERRFIYYQLESEP
ncbi:MAG TPA: Uma2 family endonuclease [Thermoanaerobaculia bacterium]|nr:Uma2 family endonuclease [Thermoanaerobaculia bacterium]